MRVLFDGFWWDRGPIANRTVMRELVHAWMRTYRDDEVILALPRRDVDAAEIPQGATAVSTRLRPHALSNMFELGRIARRERSDVIVAHNYTPLIGEVPSVVFIHDLLFEERPEWFSLKERLYFWPMSRSAHRAASVVTSTHSEARRIERLHPRLAPVTATGLAVSSTLRSAVPRRPDAVRDGERYLLAVGRLNARKNLAGAVAGFLASSAPVEGERLLIVGSSEHSGRKPEDIKELATAVEHGSVVFLGRVDDGELRWLYENARGVLFLSFDEGFGLPGLEAQHFGAPVVASDIPVFRETLDERGAYFANPSFPASIAMAIDQMRAATHQIEPLGYSWDEAAAVIRARAEAGRVS